jgi:hypothetical protein
MRRQQMLALTLVYAKSLRLADQTELASSSSLRQELSQRLQHSVKLFKPLLHICLCLLHLGRSDRAPAEALKITILVETYDVGRCTRQKELRELLAPIRGVTLVHLVFFRLELEKACLWGEQACADDANGRIAGADRRRQGSIGQQRRRVLIWEAGIDFAPHYEL